MTQSESSLFHCKSGAGNRVRTDDLLITNQLLYQLSYAGVGMAGVRQGLGSIGLLPEEGDFRVS